MPQEILDSVVVHELCHRKHMNHSKEFYAEIDRVFPDYKRCNKFVNRKAVKKQAVRVVLGLSRIKANGGVYMKRVQ